MPGGRGPNSLVAQIVAAVSAAQVSARTALGAARKWVRHWGSILTTSARHAKVPGYVQPAAAAARQMEQVGRSGGKGVFVR